ncbi:putative nucleic acid-binding protein [Lupinus albus]|uniref:Putative nucleic acid-binding protein n=1 Tax=Lupinus albus TaxID=3870 RepID=A0A6A4PSI6_LUPAL|nr:putative nucleic acid-binding protein [Lupinus albus]
MSLSWPFDFIKDVNDSKHLWKIAVRITQLWYVQIPPKSGHLEMILMDSKVTHNFISTVNVFQQLYLLKHFISIFKGDKIQVSVKKDEFNQRNQSLLENKTYVMHNFNVLRNDLQFKACDHVYRMQFTASTTLKQREFHDIPELEYNFKKFSDILSGNFRSDF